MNRVKQYISKLNWFGFIFVMALAMLGVTSNRSVESIEQWLIFVLVIGLPFSLFFLFAGKDS